MVLGEQATFDSASKTIQAVRTSNNSSQKLPAIDHICISANLNQLPTDRWVKIWLLFCEQADYTVCVLLVATTTEHLDAATRFAAGACLIESELIEVSY